MVLKRKAVATGSTSFKQLKGSRGKAALAAEEEEQPEQVEAEAEQEEGEEEEVEEKESQEAAQARKEEETVAERRKELKGLYSDELKEVVTSKGLELGKKSAMIEAVVAHEAAERAAARESAAKMRQAVTSKKQELEALPVAELRALCQEREIKGIMTKEARVTQLLKIWQEEDGVPKALAKMACDAREAELSTMDKVSLRSLCEQAGVDPFVKEIMADRIVKCEAAAGRFKRPQTQEGGDGTGAEATDIVEALLSGEASRKKEKEQKKQREEAAASKKKELKAMSNEQLKKLLSSKGLEGVGKKDEMVEMLYASYLKDAELAAKKAALKSLPLDELKKQAASRGIAKVSKKEDLVEGLLAHDRRLADEAEAYEAAVEEALQGHREDLEARTNAELKDMCAEKDLKLGTGKEERVERLLEHAKANGAMDDVVSGKRLSVRRQELLAMEVSDLEELALKAGADTLVKEVMVERLLSHEMGSGNTAAPVEEPAAKKSRKK